jgi:hypothetical protein
MNFDAIPQEMRAKRQWVCFEVDGSGRKIPYTPGTDDKAASNQSATWRSFRAACADVTEGRRSHIGYCFSSSDPYVFIDLDDIEDETQQQVFDSFTTYAQRSISGRGMHLIGRGKFDGPGRHPKSPAVGVFQQERFCLMTGDVVPGRETIQQLRTRELQSFVDFLGPAPAQQYDEVDLADGPREMPDMTVLEIGADMFPVKFNALMNGEYDFPEYHNDRSAVDHALISMLCDITPHNGQVRDLFKSSRLWTVDRQEKKAAHGPDGYINRTISKIRGKQSYQKGLLERIPLMFGPDADEDVEPERTSIIVTTPKQEIPQRGATNLLHSLPQGLLRDIAEYSYRTSFHPLQEASLATALVLMSGLCGRGYLTPTNSGLNLWLIVVGGTSCGKDEYQVGLKRILKYVSVKAPHIRKIFGGEIVSGPGIEKSFEKTKRFISYYPEFGDTFKLLANPLAPDHVKTLSRGLLNSFNAAGLGGSIEGRRKANQDEVPYIERPCLVVAGEATPESLYDAMTTRELATGFLQRFILLDAPGSSWSMTENPDHGKAPDADLLQRVANLALSMDMADATDKFKQVAANKVAGKLLHDYRRQKREEIMRSADGLIQKELINRAGLKALRVASLLAVATDTDLPVIEREHAEWAIGFVDYTDNGLLARFTSGDIGAGQAKQETVIKTVMLSLLEQPLTRGQRDLQALRNAHGVTHEELKAAVIHNAAFAGDKAGAVTAFERSIQHLVTAGTLMKFSPQESLKAFDVNKATLFRNW